MRFEVIWIKRFHLFYLILQVLDKFGGQVGQDKVQKLLGMDRNSTSFLFEEEKSDENFLKQM